MHKLCLHHNKNRLWISQKCGCGTFKNPNGYCDGSHQNKTKILKKIVVIGASSSMKSITRKFAKFAANSLKLDCKIKELALNDFEMPIYSEDLKEIHKLPVEAFNFKRVISNSDGIIIFLQSTMDHTHRLLKYL